MLWAVTVIRVVVMSPPFERQSAHWWVTQWPPRTSGIWENPWLNHALYLLTLGWLKPQLCYNEPLDTWVYLQFIVTSKQCWGCHVDVETSNLESSKSHFIPGTLPELAGFSALWWPHWCVVHEAVLAQLLQSCRMHLWIVQAAWNELLPENNLVLQEGLETPFNESILAFGLISWHVWAGYFRVFLSTVLSECGQ